MTRLTKLLVYGLPFVIVNTYAHYVRDLGEALVELVDEIGDELKLEPPEAK